MIRVALPFPHKLLWPNGSRGHVQAVSREKRKHKLWADGAALEAVQRCVDAIVVTPLVRVHIVVHAKPKGPYPTATTAWRRPRHIWTGSPSALG
jgi:hypothetical protein